jgi:hypothetical protein
MKVPAMTKIEIWAKGIVAAAISGAAGGVMTGLAAVGIDPGHFNLAAGMGATWKIGGAASMINAVIGVAAYLQKSPLPEVVEEREEERRDERKDEKREEGRREMLR